MHFGWFLYIRFYRQGTSFTLTYFLSVASAAKDNRALPALSIVVWFCLLPSPEYAGGLVAPEGCPLVLVAARAPLAVSGEDAQNGSRLATTRGGPAGVEQASPWPRCGAPTLLPHDEPSDSAVR